MCVLPAEGRSARAFTRRNLIGASLAAMLGMATLAPVSGLDRSDDAAALGRGERTTPIQAPLPPFAAPKNDVMPVMAPIIILNGLATNGLPAFNLYINGKGPERFVLATGMNGCVVLPEAAARLNLSALPDKARINVFDTIQIGPQARIDTLQFGGNVRGGGIKLANVPVVSLDVGELLSLAPRPDPPSGWLGTPFLAAFQVVLDLTSQFASLNSAQAPLKAPPGSAEVPLIVRDGRIYVRVSAGGPRGSKPFLALVDTATIGTLVPGDVVTQLKLKGGDSLPVSHPGGKAAQAATVMLPSLSVGKAEWKMARAVYILPGAPPEFDRTLGVLGIDFLRHFRIILSIAKHKMILTPLEPADDVKAP